MKRILFLLLLLPSLLFAEEQPSWQEARMTPHVLGAQVAAAAGPVLIDSYSETNFDGDYGLDMYSGNYERVGHMFTSDGKSITSAKFYLCKIGSPTGNATAALYAKGTGTYGSTMVPTGSALATSGTLDVSTLTACGSWPHAGMALKEFTFGTPYNTDADYYGIAVLYSGGDSSNKVKVALDGSSSTHSGNKVDYWGGWSAAATVDTIFYVYGE